jgi:hypothetical protein
LQFINTTHNTAIPKAKAALLNSVPSLSALQAMHPAKQTACTNVQKLLAHLLAAKKSLINFTDMDIT